MDNNKGISSLHIHKLFYEKSNKKNKHRRTSITYQDYIDLF